MAVRRRGDAFTAGGDARYYGSDGGVRLVSSWPKMRGGYAFVPPPLAAAQLDSYATGATPSA